MARGGQIGTISTKLVQAFASLKLRFFAPWILTNFIRSLR